MGAVTLDIAVAGKLQKFPGAPLAKEQGMLGGFLTMSASYATNGDTIDLSKYFESVDFGLITSPSGLVLEFVDDANPALCKVKAYRSLPQHAHDLKVVGGAAVAGTKATQALAGVLSKEEAADATLTGGTDNIQNKFLNVSDEVSAATNLSTYEASFLIIGKPLIS